MLKNTTLSLALASSLAATAYAHGGATGIVKDRMDAMAAMAAEIRVIAPMMRGETAYDVASVRAAAQTFSFHSGVAMTNLYPEGTGGSPSASTAKVWSDPDGFAQLADQLSDYAEGLSRAARNGVRVSPDGQNAPMTMDMSTIMMGASGPSVADAESIDFSTLPANEAFELVAQTCASCHATYRSKG